MTGERIEPLLSHEDEDDEDAWPFFTVAVVSEDGYVIGLENWNPADE